jgi:hypothetical protein
VPRVSLPTMELGIAPEAFALSGPLHDEIEAFLADRCLLGTQVNLQTPQYVGVSVQAVLGVEPDYQVGTARVALRQSLARSLYEWLNPLTGGKQGDGWPMGTSLYQSDLVGLFQRTKGVQYLETLQLFELRPETDWQRQLVTTGLIDPGPRGVLCSWAEVQRQSAHRIQFLGGEMNP